MIVLSLVPAISGQIKIDPQKKGKVFEGIGALSAGASSRLLQDYPKEQQGQIFDLLFKPKFGASLHHLKVEIGGDVNSTSGTEPSHQRTRQEAPDFHRGYEWMLMKEARQRNPSIYLDCLEWGAPGWIGEGQFYSADNINYIISFIKGAAREHGLTIDYTGIWNERMHDTEYMKNFKKALLANGLAHVRLVGTDLCCRSQWTIADDMKADPELMRVVDVIGDHYPEVDCGYNTSANAKASGKPLWNSEGGPWKGTWEGFSALAKLYNRDYIIGGMTKTITWSLITSYYENLALPNSGLMKADSPWSGYYEVEPALWAAAHTTQFTEPGWSYIEEACGLTADSTMSYVSLLSPDNSDLTIIIETMDAAQPKSLTFQLPRHIKALSQWRSIYQQESFMKQRDVSVKNGTLTLQLEPHALYTFSTTKGQQKGEFAIPDSVGFKLPYKEDFESYKPASTPRYLSDQGGAFEVRSCQEGRGQVLRQLITRPAIEWEGAVVNQTVVGDQYWKDYTTSVDVRFRESYSHASLSGRVTETYRSHKEPEGYTLRLFTTGNWQLLSAGKVLQKGVIRHFDSDHTYQLKLDFAGEQITGWIDGTAVVSLSDPTQERGMVSLGTSFHQVDFDNLQIHSQE